MGEKMAQAGQNTLLGVGTVFVMLIFLCFVISLMKYIPGFVESFGKKKAVPEEIQVPAAPAAPVIDVYKRQHKSCPCTEPRTDSKGRRTAL